MKQTNYNKTINTIDEVFSNAVRNGIFHLYTEDEVLDGRTIKIRGKQVVNFGSCSYLGLELHPKVIEGSIAAIRKYGTQFSSSRAYLSLGLYKELESRMERIFKTPVVIAPSTTLAHNSAIPVLVEDKDAVIIDFQVHASVQDAVSKLYKRGIPIEMIRHNRMDELEEKLNQLGQKYDKIWYMADGIYSMYGDAAPMDKLVELMKQYKQLHVYADDAHGMSWTGKDGCGYIYSQIAPHPKVILATSLAKGFGIAGGGIISSPDPEIIRRIRTCGSTLIFSGPMGPYALGAAIASADIHLSEEINQLQKQLKDRLAYTYELLKQHQLPVISDTPAPIFYVGVSSLKVGYNMDKRLLNEGYYANIGLFPGVPVRRTGIRFTNTTHHTKEDIKGFIEAIAYHFPKALAEEGVTKKQVYKAFELPYQEEMIPSSTNRPFTIQHERTIKAFNQTMWDELLGNHSAFDWEGLVMLEESFSKNEKTEDNWEFHYYMITDQNHQPIIATYFTLVLTKDDMFDPENISTQIENHRKHDKYYLTSRSLMMGNLMSIGNHTYINRQHTQWKEALKHLLEEVTQEKERQKASSVYLRDFDPEDTELKEFLGDLGYIRIDLPDNHILEEFNWNNSEEYLATIKPRDRNKIRKDVLKPFNCFEITQVENPSEEKIKHYYQLYLNIKNKNKEINIFEFPEKLFHHMSHHKQWDIIELNLKPEFATTKEKTTIAVGFSYKSTIYYTSILGMDYDYADYGIYRQMLFQAIMRTKQLNLKQLVMGLTASIEKQRFGAKVVKSSVYAQLDDNYNRMMISTLANRKQEQTRQQQTLGVDHLVD